ncbi:TrkH family potassium uptake protein [Pedobacter sp.]|uniref:TrkH family potassium uptake protein n=1 Tax=Pedobacter sp. TaxID=1411316 RepID=UPI003D7F630E
MLYLSSLASIAIIFNIGYVINMPLQSSFDRFLLVLFNIFGVVLIVRSLRNFSATTKISRFGVAEIIFCLYFLAVVMLGYVDVTLFNGFFKQQEWIYVGIFGVFLIEVSKNALFFDRFYFNPTLLFVFSFLLLIFLGTILLLMPNTTTTTPLRLVDAIFMATSAVCITGLSVIDISAEFSTYGKIVLITLVQLGGLGIMTFTGFFGYFFSGGFSYKNQLMYTEILGENKLNSVIQTLLKIITITLLFEIAGGIFIYLSIDNTTLVFKSAQEKIFFTIFHTISSFCNAGFSIVPEGLFYPSLRFNYGLHLITALLFILGGLGFGIVFNTYEFVKRWTINIFRRIVYRENFKYKAWAISFNSRLIAWTTLILLVVGTLVMLLLEYNNSLSIYESLPEKLSGAFFMGAVPRSAGFNVVNMDLLSFPAIMFIMLLMWIGTAPGSTGGGIKITTFAVAVLNMVSIAKGKDRVEIFNREISHDSVRRASAVILLSLFSLGLTIFCLSITDGDKDLLALAFESFSAFSTVGLSLGITPEMSDGGRLVLAISMFVGRVGTLTLVIALMKKVAFKSYHYPQEKVLY